MVLVGEREDPRLGIVYVMGPHRFFANGAERLFYHHAIRSQAEAVCREGALLLGLNGAAALGAGRRRRLPAAPRYDSTSVADIAAAAAHLRGLGAPRVVLVAASLGCLPAIRFLAAEQIDGAVLLNPVYSSEIPPLRPWRQLYGPDSLLEAALDRHAPSIRTPLLIVHGQRDPISPSQHSSDFFMALPEDLECDYVSVPDEGHIFQTDAGWRILLEKTRGFLEAALSRQEERIG
jgi:pimeloyl-ACP methyl ester carboxylesterase